MRELNENELRKIDGGFDFKDWEWGVWWEDVKDDVGDIAEAAVKGFTEGVYAGLVFSGSDCGLAIVTSATAGATIGAVGQAYAEAAQDIATL